MQVRLRHFFPAIYGLLVYTCIRLVNDTGFGIRFWLRPWHITVLEVGMSILTSYITIFIVRKLAARFNRRTTSKLTAMQVLKEFAVITLVSLLLNNLLLIPFEMVTDNGLQLIDVVLSNVIPTLFILLYYAILRGNGYLNNYIQQQLQTEKIKNDQLATELKFLKAQYHPHFLFNALNTVYFQMDEDVQAAKQTIEGFSSLLRYQLYNQQQTVPIAEELQYLKHFIQLQQLRMNKALISFNTDPELQGHLYPLLLLPLIENACKYADGQHPISINATHKEGWLQFTVENRVPHVGIAIKKGGIGLENLKRRLSLLYNNQHQFQVRHTTDCFKVQLSIPLFPKPATHA
ncbi:sensor histidine kinase [Deminuibacter soli]|uniref:Histidine kinase n=1 Tax=Deminuibacter soli TaxID=2291815 RepID=A0A3E1NJY9_9BACT|nr:sensor histidine kinase [Deminuibacter soli]RFM28256.1 histidine kinase [Deminuibacter soli]